MLHVCSSISCSVELHAMSTYRGRIYLHTYNKSLFCVFTLSLIKTNILRVNWSLFNIANRLTLYLHFTKGPFLWSFTNSKTRQINLSKGLVFSCPQQLNRWPCHSVTQSLTDWQYFYFWHYRVTLETCDLWDIWSEWWGNMTWPTF